MVLPVLLLPYELFVGCRWWQNMLHLVCFYFCLGFYFGEFFVEYLIEVQVTEFWVDLIAYQVLSNFKYLFVHWIHYEPNLKFSFARFVIDLVLIIIKIYLFEINWFVIFIFWLFLILKTKRWAPAEKRAITYPIIFVLGVLNCTHLNGISHLTKKEQVTKII